MDKKTGKKEKQKSGKLRKTGNKVPQVHEEKLKVPVDQLRTAFDAIKDAVSLIDAEGKILQCNRAMSDFLGKPSTEIIGRRCRELVHGTSEPIAGCPVARMKETRQRETLELPIGDKWFEVTADPILDESGGFNGAIHIISDITGCKRLEDALRKSEEHYRYIVETTNEGIWIIDSENRTTFVNTAIVQMLGYSPEEMIGIPLDNFIFEEDLADHNSQMAICHRGKPGKYERRLKRKDGSICYCLVSGTAMHDAEGRFAGAFAMVADITDLKRKEEAIRRSEYRYRTLVENIPDYVMRYDRQYRHVFTNSRTLRDNKKTAEEFIGKTHRELGFPAHLCDIWEKAIDHVFKTGEPQVEVFEWESAVGVKVLEWRLYPEIIQNGSAETVLGISQDITERKQAEMALQRSKELYQRFIDSSSDDVFLKDEQLRILIVNKSYRERMCKKEEEILGKTAFDLLPIKTAEDCTKSDIEALESDGVIISEEQLGDRIFETRKFRVNLGDDKFGVGGYIRDITERKQAEETILKEKLLTDSIMNNVPAGIALLDNDFVLRKSNSTYADLIYKYLSIIPEQALGMSYFDYAPGSRDQVEEWFQKVRDSGQVDTRYGFKLVLKDDGKDLITYWDTSVAPVLNTSGKVEGILILTRDVTERKQAEEALRESEEKLGAMLQSIGDHMSMLDKDLNIIWANEIAKNKFGNDIIGKKCYEVYHGRKEPCEPYPCLTLKAFQDGKIHDHDTQMIDKEGRMIYFHCTANVALRDKEGKPTAVIEISRDMTERKRAEEKTREKMREIERLNKLFIGREHFMVELKREVNTLLERLGQPGKYEAPDRVDQLKNLMKKENGGA